MHVLEMISEFIFAVELPLADGASIWRESPMHAVHVA